MISDERRFGRFFVDVGVRMPEGLERVRDIMRLLDCVVIRAEYMYAEAGIEYTAWAKIFPVVRLGDHIPKYALHVVIGEGGMPVKVNVLDPRL